MNDKSKLSLIKSIDKVKLQYLMDSNRSKRDVVKSILNIETTPHSTYITYLTKMIKIMDIDLTIHDKLHSDWRELQSKSIHKNKRKSPISDLLTENSHYDSSHIKKRCIKEGILDNVCCVCGCSNVWQEKPISLQLDHINGNNTDNRLQNLRILCPNCHSQTDTYCSKKLKLLD